MAGFTPLSFRPAHVGLLAAAVLSVLSAADKNRILRAVGAALRENASYLQEENARDVAAAAEKGLPAAMIDRLTLKEATIAAMAAGCDEVAALDDPVGKITSMWRRPNGLLVGRMRIPLGVIGIIYESRPNVTVDAAALCLKSGNAVILRGGSEAINSNRAVAGIITDVLKRGPLPPEAIQLIPMTDREAVYELLQLEEWIDLIIPRGGEDLIRTVVSHSKIPVIKHYKGVCHVFVDETAELEMAVRICMNAKVQRPGVCNALETLLVHREIAPRFLPLLAEQYRQAGVTLRGCPVTEQILPGIAAATEADWHAEYLDLILAVRVVEDLDAAMDHIRRHGSGHTEAIVTEDRAAARRFVAEVDAAAVMVNASTRFTDGGEFGFGAEIGISTQKLHARGPMALPELTTTKWIVEGDGQTRS